MIETSHQFRAGCPRNAGRFLLLDGCFEHDVSTIRKAADLSSRKVSGGTRQSCRCRWRVSQDSVRITDGYVFLFALPSIQSGAVKSPGWFQSADFRCVNEASSGYCVSV
jgi:hypothetical protein